MYAVSLTTPVGEIVVVEEDDHIVRVRWSTESRQDKTLLLRNVSEQIAAYFRNDLTAFDLPLRPGGSEFQRDVCDAMLAIPFGETRTYGELAEGLGVFAQAVGQACGHNPIPIIIPCHRVLGANGLGGFSGGEGLETKMQLLRHEGAFPYLL
ncbi:MAG: methylated-DNA--[protein]-cysteine S-methyltransferase [Gammaproteobacteria bacterium]|nr:methylated-DNA--[protein]-cysteine S-methyltransferase [Gammaproteobacteria bacterium]MDX2461588.1 methylated-DNA--[protein]-cysteine S-methyltransferase [Gammaproteobacteria bacterium]